MKIAIYGAGAMGTVFGSLLTKYTNEEIDLISRNKDHINALKKGTAKINCTADNKELEVKVNALFVEEMKEKYDVIFLMTKQKENKKIAEFLKDYLSIDGIICTLQNGLPELSLEKVLDKEKIYGGIATWGADFVSPGIVNLTSSLDHMNLKIGSLIENKEKLNELYNILKNINEFTSNEFVQITDNLIGCRWSKLSINAAFSGLSTLTGLSFGEIAKKKKTRKVALKALRECFLVAKAANIKTEKMQGHDLEKLLGNTSFFGKMFAYMILPLAMKGHKDLHSGMLKDLERGRKCEIDFIDGVVSGLGKKYNVLTPVIDRIVEITHGIENGLYEISYETIDFFDEI